MEEKGELSAHAGMRQRKTAEIMLRNPQLDNRDHLRTISIWILRRSRL